MIKIAGNLNVNGQCVITSKEAAIVSIEASWRGTWAAPTPGPAGTFIAVDSLDQVGLVWYDDDNHNIYYSKQVLGTWQPPELIYDSESLVYIAGFVFDNQDKPVVAVEGSILQKVGTEWQATQAFDPALAFNNQVRIYHIKLAPVSKKILLVARAESSPYNYNLYGRILFDQVLGPTKTINHCLTSNLRVEAVSVAINNNDNVVIGSKVIPLASNYPLTISSVHFNLNDASWESLPVSVSTIAISDYYLTGPSVTIDSLANTTLFYTLSDWESWVDNIIVGTYSAASSTYTSVGNISSTNHDSDAVSCQLSASETLFVFLRYEPDNPPTKHLYRVYNSQTQTFSAEQVFDSNNLNNSMGIIVPDLLGNAFYVSVGDNYRITSAKYDRIAAKFTSIVDLYQISNPIYYAGVYKPIVATLSTGNVLAVSKVANASVASFVHFVFDAD